MPTLDYETPLHRAAKPSRLITGLRIMGGTSGMLGCAVAALFVPPLWLGQGGRDFRPQGLLAGLLIFIFAALLRWLLHWRLGEFVGAFLALQFICLLAISHFTGSSGTELLEPFELSWLYVLNQYTGFPWLIGLIVGSGLMEFVALRHRR